MSTYSVSKISSDGSCLTFGSTDMNLSHGGDFTKSLLSLQLQLKTLLEGVGGEETATLLDALAQLSQSERSISIPLLSQTIKKIALGEQRLMSAEDQELKNFEDSLFESVLTALGGAANDADLSKESAHKLAVVPGGKATTERVIFKKPIRVPALIDLAKERESRKQRNSTPG